MQSGPLDPSIRTVRGIWRTTYALKLAPHSTVLHLGYVLIQTEHQGCSYFELARDDPGVSESLIGCDALTTAFGSRPLEIAALDAVYGSIVGPPDDEVLLTGPNVTKAADRAGAICSEVVRLVRDIGLDPSAASVVNVGVVGDFLAEFVNAGMRVTASDFYSGIVGTRPHGVYVEHGSRTRDLIANADIGVVTGMTLATETLDGILEAAQMQGTKLIVFAETGANFARAYCDYGVDVVVSEPWPFYLSGPGETALRIYRRK